MKRDDKPGLASLSTLILGTIVFLETQSPIAGAVLPAVHAGWRSFRTAIWISRSGRAYAHVDIHCAFALATACWQAAAAALGSVVVFMAVASFTGKKPDMAHFAATMIALTSGVALCTLLGLWAVIAAAVRKTRVWVHPRLREILSADLDSIVQSSSERFNYAVFVLATSVSAPILAGSCFLLIEAESAAYGLTLMLGGQAAALGSYIWLSPRVIAAHPLECWMPEDFPPPHSHWS